MFPYKSHAHVPIGLVKVIIFGIITLILLAIISILYKIKKPNGLLYKIPFIISLIMVLLTLFFNNNFESCLN